MRISSLRACSACFEGTSFKFVIFTEGIKNSRLKNGKTDAYAELTHQFLMRMLSMRTSALRVCSACASVPVRMLSICIKAGHTCKEVKFFTNFLRTSKIKNFKKSLLTLTNDLTSSTEKNLFWPQLRKKTSLKTD